MTIRPIREPRFLEKRRFYIPGLMDSYVPLAREEAASKLEEHSRRVYVQTPDSQVPVRLTDTDDLQELAALEQPAQGVPGALQQLAGEGWRFVHEDREVGVFGALHVEGAVAMRNGVKAPLTDPVGLASFYRSHPYARLEESGYRFFDAERRPVSAFAAESVGKDKPWIPLGELTPETAAVAEGVDLARADPVALG